MTDEEAGVDPQDAAAIAAFEAAVARFTQDLNRLHIAGGAPPYATMAGASIRPRLTKAGLNEMLSGKRFTSLESLLEFVRVVTTPRDLDAATAAKFRTDPALVKEWRGRWQDVKMLQRQAQPGNKRLRATVRQILDGAVGEAEALRGDARAEAERIRTSAQDEAARLRAQARRDAEKLLDGAREAAGLAHGSPHGPGPQTPARAGPLWAAGRVLRPALRPLAAASTLAGLALAATLGADALTGAPGNCRAVRTPAAGLAFPAGRQDPGTVQQAAFAHKPQSIVPFPSSQTLRAPFGFPSGPSSSPSTDPPPTPSATPTPSPTPAPSTSPTPTASPSPARSRSDPCATQTRGR
ncbi:hypothetical protein [Streptomyces sp. NPDC003034]